MWCGVELGSEQLSRSRIYARRGMPSSSPNSFAVLGARVPASVADHTLPERVPVTGGGLRSEVGG
jgi:hypothetical protein